VQLPYYAYRLDVYTREPEESGRYYKELFDLVASDLLKFEIFKEYPFTAAGTIQAQKDLTGGRTFGKLLLKV
jgi:NADPH2:quinone reductase